ncbi:PQQ-dependent sugar dehydrogenase [Peribacillus alkalitolerans]|uniref:PQQ-dependent sugar dehydrogenase n=1 Tax=Peribacillus alkalitolerans TaxID=1550385 RepID=UPI0013D7006A|nr:PQQ-dependent sugar dehydrogenase [Peribacillus alkalitolerans]
MKKSIRLIGAMVLAGVFSLSGCSEKARENSESQSSEATLPISNEAEVIAKSLQIPWSIQKDGETFYISERTGTIAVIQSGTVHKEQVSFQKKLSANPEAGFLGLVLSSDFSNTGRAFGYYTYDEDGRAWNRVVELTRSGQQWHEGEILLDRIPSGQFHHGGRLKIGTDGLLYVTTGDAHEDENAQNLHSLGGKILRMNLDGSVPRDNPFEGSYVFSYGHRNPQGLAWSETGDLYESEHGPSGHDELNKIEPGQNYGWPQIIGDETKPGKVNPLIHAGNNTWAPSGIAYYKGHVIVATLRGEAVKIYNLKSGEMKDLYKGVGRVRDVYVEGDTLYFVTNNTDGRGVPAKDDDKLYKMDLTKIE